MNEIQAGLEALANDFSHGEEKNFSERMKAIDFLEFNLPYLEDLLLNDSSSLQLQSLNTKAENLKAKLETVNNKLFDQLREAIRTRTYLNKGFKDLIRLDLDFSADHRNEPGYDELDFLINGLFSSYPIPEQGKALESEMVFYQKTPARIIFELAEKCKIKKEDVFFDLGSGLGQVAILINLLTGIAVKGIEFDPAFCDYATRCAVELELMEVEFINADARDADYSKGTIFFLYTPFTGSILQSVLKALQKEALTRKIRVATYGPCTAEVALQSWLHFEIPKDLDPYKLAVFNS